MRKLVRDHQRCQHDHEEQVAARECEPGERISSHCAEEQVAGRDNARQQQAARHHLWQPGIDALPDVHPCLEVRVRWKADLQRLGGGP